MRKWKRVTSIALAGAMCAGVLAGCSGGGDKDAVATTQGNEVTQANGDTQASDSEETTTLPPMTTENIELTYMNFDNKVLTEYLAEKFMEKYPNIKVNVIYVGAADNYNDTLLNYVNTGQTPDCFMILGNCDFALSNDLLGDMTQYWEMTQKIKIFYQVLMVRN